MKRIISISILLINLFVWGVPAEAQRPPSKSRPSPSGERKEAKFSAETFFTIKAEQPLSLRSIYNIDGILKSLGFECVSNGTATLKSEWEGKISCLTQLYVQSDGTKAKVYYSSSVVYKMEFEFLNSEQCDNFVSSVKSEWIENEPGSYMLNGYLDSDAYVDIRGNNVTLSVLF